jgi:DNA-binding NarL/FixJ family response regulator
MENQKKKYKRNVLCLKKRIDIIQKLENGAKIKNVAKEFGIKPNTVSTIKKNKSKWIEMVRKFIFIQF